MDLKEEMLNFRAKNNLSQRRAAERAQITNQTWYAVENGYQNPSKMTEMKIRKVIAGDTINQSN